MEEQGKAVTIVQRNDYFKDSHQHSIASPDLKLKRTNETDENERRSIVHEGVNEDQQQQNSTQNNRFQETNLQSFKQIFAQKYQHILKKTQRYCSDQEEMQFFETPSVQIKNNATFKFKRQTDLLMTQNQALCDQIQRLNLKLDEYNNHTKEIEAQSKKYFEMSKQRKIMLAKANKRIDELERKNAKQKKRLEQLFEIREQSVKDLRQCLESNITEQLKNIVEANQNLMQNIKYIFWDHQSDISLSRERQIGVQLLTSPESYRIIQKLTNSFETAKQRLLSIQSLAKSKICYILSPSLKIRLQQCDQQEKEACNEELDSEEFESIYELGLEQQKEL